MKTKLAILLSALAMTAQAHLIELTPGGFNVDEGLPPAFFQLSGQTFFDQAVQDFPGWPTNGWVSQFGRINGGVFFNTDLIGRSTQVAAVSWNMFGEPDHYFMYMIDVFGRDADGRPWENIYGVTGAEWFEGSGIVRVHEDTRIMGISFYGSNFVSDTGSTLMLAWAAYALVLVVFVVKKAWNA